MPDEGGARRVPDDEGRRALRFDLSCGVAELVRTDSQRALVIHDGAPLELQMTAPKAAAHYPFA